MADITCAGCRRKTPDGQYCSYCGSTLRKQTDHFGTLLDASAQHAGRSSHFGRTRIEGQQIASLLGVEAWLGAYALEYLLIGLATAVFGVFAGSVAAWMIVTRLMTLTFVWQGGSAAGVVAAALVVTVGLGLAGTLLALNKKPATVLRNL